jgi:sulfatase maturation enzyme AslB (radical SAM superfamily)
MNILITDFCNRACPYCFAKDKLAAGKAIPKSSISLKNLKIIADFLKRSAIKTIGVLGGEPTLHPQFQEAISLFIDRQICVRLFSNGLIRKDHLMFLRRLGADKVHVVLNLNDPRGYTKKERLAVNRTGELLNQQVTIGVTIHEVDFTMEFVARFIESHGTQRKVRLGIALPQIGADNKFVKPADYRRVAARIVDCVEENYGKITFAFDCGFTMCSFTAAQLGRLFRSGAGMNFVCPVSIDIGPDLSVWACFPMRQLWNRKITEFKDAAHLRRFYLEKLQMVHRLGGIRFECRTCIFYKFRQCAGGCAGHVINSFTPSTQIVHAVHALTGFAK